MPDFTLAEKTQLRIAGALERMAAADERRNELLEADQAERRRTWAKSELENAERWAELVALPAQQEAKQAEPGA